MTTTEDPTGKVDALLAARVASAHHEAEETYLRALDRGAPTVPALNGKAEGLAEAFAILSGEDVIDVRARACEAISAQRGRALDGIGRARAALDQARKA